MVSVATGGAAVTLLYMGFTYWTTGLLPMWFPLQWIWKNYLAHRNNAVLNEQLPVNLNAALSLMNETDDPKTKHEIRILMAGAILKSQQTGYLESTGPPPIKLE